MAATYTYMYILKYFCKKIFAMDALENWHLFTLPPLLNFFSVFFIFDKKIKRNK